jgi:hypothetical protein
MTEDESKKALKKLRTDFVEGIDKFKKEAVPYVEGIETKLREPRKDSFAGIVDCFGDRNPDYEDGAALMKKAVLSAMVGDEKLVLRLAKTEMGPSAYYCRGKTVAEVERLEAEREKVLTKWRKALGDIRDYLAASHITVPSRRKGKPAADL